MKDHARLLKQDAAAQDSGAREFEQLLAQPVETTPQSVPRQRIEGVIVGTLIGFLDAYEPLVIYPGQPGSAAVPARASVDLCAEHIGDAVTLVFEHGDAAKPIVTGRIRVPSPWPTPERPPQLDVDADGRRVILTARDQLTLKCGKASLTLTAAGKVVIQGVYVSQLASGAMRIKGGSVQIN
jgi:hypothetical protein